VQLDQACARGGFAAAEPGNISPSESQNTTIFISFDSEMDYERM